MITDFEDTGVFPRKMHDSKRSANGNADGKDHKDSEEARFKREEESGESSTCDLRRRRERSMKVIGERRSTSAASETAQVCSRVRMIIAQHEVA